MIVYVGLPVCLSVCLSVCRRFKNQMFTFHQNVLCICHGRHSILERCNTLCTSGFVDGVTLSYNGLSVGRDATEAVSLQCPIRPNTPVE